MIIPENGSVVIIDDKPNQAAPIVKAFAKKGIATIYFKGTSKNELPDNPLTSVRLAIVDLQLLDTDTDEHNIATRLINVLQKVISSENGPYMLMIWSLKNNTFSEEFKLLLRDPKNGIVPICITSLNKSECLDSVDNSDKIDFVNDIISDLKQEFDNNQLDLIKTVVINNIPSDIEYEAKHNAVDIIENNLVIELKKAGVFHLFVIWENLIRRAGVQTVKAISSAIEYTDLWEINMRDVFKRMALAKVGKNTLTDDLQLKAALSIFSASFSEELESKIKQLEFPEHIDLDSNFAIAGQKDNDIYKVVIYQEQETRKVKLLKNDILYKNKENINFAKITSLSDGLDQFEKPLIENLVEKYQDVPFHINSQLHIEQDPSEGHMPGNVYLRKVDNTEKQTMLSTYFDKIPDDASLYNFIELEVSPLCDYAQNKWKKSRLLSGLVYPSSSKIKKGEYFYRDAPCFIVENNKYNMAFCYLYFKASDVDEVERRGKPWFRIKRELLQDIVSGLTGHLNRAGIVSIT